MSGLDLGKQVGPLPLGAWVVVVGGALGVAWYTQKNKAPVEPTTDTSADPGVGVGGSGQWTQVGVPTTDTTTPTITTNEQWGQAAINYLIGKGYPPVVSDSAIRKYLTSAKLGVQEYVLVQEALARLGAPPSTLPPTDDGTDDDTDVPATMSVPLNVNGYSVWQNSIELHWDKVDGAVAYKITVSPNPEAGSATWPISGGKMIGGLQKNTSYTITVAGVAASGIVGPASPPVIIKTKA